MARFSTVSVLAFASMACMAPSAGPMGHNALAYATVERILAGTYDAPADLKALLKDPQMRQMFAGGSVGPDLFPDKTHRGSQSQFTQDMIKKAQAQFDKAKASGDEEARRKAGEGLAFAYGWLSHVAVDLEVHPVVNGETGDAYDYNNEGEKLTHSALEAQLYAYIKRVVGQKQPFDAKVPYEFVAEQFGVDEAEARRATARLRIIAAGEIVSANQVTLSDKQLKDIWGGAVSESMNDVSNFIKDPATFENWDLDVGKISTQDFEWLRRAALSLNGEKLPKNWGKNYLKLWDLVKDLPATDRAGRLAEEFSRTSGFTGSNPGTVPSLALTLAKERNAFDVWIGQNSRHYPPPLGPTNSVPVKWNGAKFSVSIRTDMGGGMVNDLTVEGELASDSMIAWIKGTNVQDAGFRNIRYTTVFEAKNVVRENYIWDDASDLTFCVWNIEQAPNFSCSVTVDGKLEKLWDRTNAFYWGTERRYKPVFRVRFRPLK